MPLRVRIVGDGPALPATSAVDAAEVRRALEALADPKQGCELRGLPSGRSIVREGCDLAGLVEAAEELAGNRGVYYALNPVRPDLGRGTNMCDVLYRRNLLIDVDAVKPADQKDNPSTDAEHEAAHVVALAVREHLSKLSWPLPQLIDSGNGWHLVYRLDLPNDDHSRLLLRRLLYRLAEQFDGPGGTIDRAVHNASRIARLPGTLARKGNPSRERPWRPCRLVERQHPAVVVTAEQILLAVEQGQESGRLVPQPAPAGEPRPAGLTATAVNHDPARAWAQAALERECGRVALANAPGRNNQLNTSAYSLGQIVAGGGLDRPVVELALLQAAIRCGLDQDPGCGPAGIEATIRSGLESGAQSPRTAPEPSAPKAKSGKPAVAAVQVEGPILVRANTIEPRRVEWLWPGRIPLGKLTTFAGVGGLGKTFVLCDVTVRVIRGDEWPSSGGECAEPGQVLFISGEDDPDDTLVPRMLQLGAEQADLRRVLFLSPKALGKFSLANGVLEQAVEESRQGELPLRMIAIDPPTGYLAGVDDHKNAELRGVLVGLKNAAAEHQIAIVLNTHLNKGGAGKVEAMMRVMGSVAWVNAVRAAHLFARDPDNPERRLFVPMKNNLGPERKGLAYKIRPTDDDQATIEWLGEIDTTADQAVGREEPKRKREVVAKDWLIEKFQEKREWHSADLFRMAREEHVSRNAIFEAKDLLDIPKARKVSLESGDVVWVWWVPADWPHLSPEGAHIQKTPQLPQLEEVSF